MTLDPASLQVLVSRLTGVAEEDCTIWVPDGWRAEPGPLGALVVTRS